MNTGADFESYVHFVYETLLNLKGEQIQVARRTTFKLASGETYEIDVYYEFTRVGVRHRVGIECKDWKSPVKQGQILEFHQKLKNIGEDIVGVFVSRVGYQSGALAVAKRHNILTLAAEDIPTIPNVLAGLIKTAWIPEDHCAGEPFWCIAELSDNPSQGTGVYFALPPDCPLRLPLFLSRKHAIALHQRLPDKEEYGVFGLPQYKLRGMLMFALIQNMQFGIVIGPPLPDGRLEMLAVDAKTLRDEYLLPQFQAGLHD